jgi:LEA14-like dessication related protein
MNTGTTLLILVGAGAVLTARAFKRQGENVDVQLLTGSFTGVNVQELKGNLTFRVINPEPVALNLKGIFFKTYLGDSEVATIANFDQANIAARSQQNIKLNFSLPMLSVVAAVPDIIEQFKAKKITVGLNGFVDTSIGRITTEKVLTFNIPF